MTKILLSTYYVSSPVLVRCSDRVVIIYDFTELTITDKTSGNFLLNRNIFFIIGKMLCDYFTKILYDLVHLVTLYKKSLSSKCCALTYPRIPNISQTTSITFKNHPCYSL